MATISLPLNHFTILPLIKFQTISFGNKISGYLMRSKRKKTFIKHIKWIKKKKNNATIDSMDRVIEEHEIAIGTYNPLAWKT